MGETGAGYGKLSAHYVAEENSYIILSLAFIESPLDIATVVLAFAYIQHIMMEGEYNDVTT